MADTRRIELDQDLIVLCVASQPIAFLRWAEKGKDGLTDLRNRYISNLDGEVGPLVHDHTRSARLWDVEYLLFGVRHRGIV